MKMPNKFRTHCPFCKTHTEHTIQRVKKGSGLEELFNNVLSDKVSKEEKRIIIPDSKIIH